MKIKSSSSPLGAALGLALLSTSAHAATVLIDGTAPDYTRNGSFETTTFWEGSGSTLAGDLGIGGSGGLAYRTNASGRSDGSRYIVVEQRGFGAFQDTGHTLSLSETFNLSFYHGLHQSGGNPATNDATVDWQLFTSTTNSNTGVVDQVIASGSVLGNETTTPIEVSLSSIGTVPAGSVGDRLFISFTSSLGSNLTSLYSVDEVNLSVIPEPSTALLGGLGLLAMLRRRR